jgi:type VI secretion system secreted protein Hcp
MDMFLKIDGIQGESISKAHPNEIDVLSFSWGESNSSSAASGGGTGAGKVEMQDFHFVMPVTRASPKLFLKCADGTTIPSAVLTVARVSPKTGTIDEFLKWTFSDVQITSYQEGGSDADLAPLDQVSFNFNKIEVSYDGAGGVTEAGWDVMKNEKI